MSFNGKEFTHYRPGMPVKARDLNEAFSRLERLEKLVGDSYLTLQQSAFSQSIALTKDIPEIEFIKIKENLTCDTNLLFDGVLLDRDLEETTIPIQFRNLFGLVQPDNEEPVGFVIRFPRGRGEWVLLQFENCTE